jgi:hypothetical protein
MWPKPTNFVRLQKISPKSIVDILTTYGWYGACSANWATMVTKMPNTTCAVDRNWQWPEKTWFRERLNALKARELEERRRPQARTGSAKVSTPAFDDNAETLKAS